VVVLLVIIRTLLILDDVIGRERKWLCFVFI